MSSLFWPAWYTTYMNLNWRLANNLAASFELTPKNWMEFVAQKNFKYWLAHCATRAQSNPPYYFLRFQIQAEGPLEDPRWDCPWEGPQLRVQPVRASLRPKVPPGHPRVRRSRGQEATRLSPLHPQVSQEVRPTKTPQDCTQHPPAQAGVATNSKVFLDAQLSLMNAKLSPANMYRNLYL